MIIKNPTGIDQNGKIYKNLGQYPRKALMERLNCSPIKKWEEFISYAPFNWKYHVGYKIKGLHIRLLWGVMTLPYNYNQLKCRILRYKKCKI